MDKNSTVYTVGFAAIVCLVCGIAVASSAVGLRERQEENKVVDRKAKVLAAAGLLPEGKVTAEQITNLYEENVIPNAGNGNAHFDEVRGFPFANTNVTDAVATNVGGFVGGGFLYVAYPFQASGALIFQNGDTILLGKWFHVRFALGRLKRASE